MDSFISNIRTSSPMILNLTNYVTANDVANVLLALGASPCMSDSYEEMDDMTDVAQGVNINIGTVNSQTVSAMLLAGIYGNQKGLPCVLDAVGAGASSYRTKTAKTLINHIHFSLIKGNISEIKALFGKDSHTEGVDASEDDLIDETNLQQALSFVMKKAKKHKTIILATGPIDIIADGTSAYLIHNGCKQMAQVTGTGCQLSALLCATLAANGTRNLEAAAMMVCTMGIVGEMSVLCLEPGEGNASLRTKMIDRFCYIDDATIEKMSRYEIQ